MSWYIVKVSPQRERSVRNDLTELYAIPAYVPVEIDSTRYGRGKESIRVRPLIRGYVFADLDEHTWRHVSAHRLCHGVVTFGGSAATLTGKQVKALEHLSQGIKPRQARKWTIGDRLRIRRGAFAELEAIIAKINQGQIVATVEMFGKQHQVIITEDLLEAA